MGQIKHGYSIREACKVSGFRTAKMVHYLVREGLIEPTIRGRKGRGVRYVFSYGDLVVLRTINRLLGAGVSVRKLKLAIQQLSKKFAHLKRRDHFERFLITDGSEVYYREDGAIFSSDGQIAFSFVLDMREIVQTTKIEIEKLPVRRPKQKTPKVA